MLVKIGVADTNKVIELEAESADQIRQMLEDAFSVGQSLIWLTDTKARLVAVPLERLAYVEIDQNADSRQVGFARAGS